jgi:hypothetical protein
MTTFVEAILPVQSARLSQDAVEVTVRVEVPSETDVVWVEANQDLPGVGTSGRVKMERVSAHERALTLPLRDVAKLGFFRAEDGDARAWVHFGGTGIEEGRMNGRVMIRPESGGAYAYRILDWTN